MPMAGVWRDHHRVARPDFLHRLPFQLVAANAREICPTACWCQLVRPPGMKVTREARSREGPSGAHTGSDITGPTKFAASALDVGRLEARMILGFIRLSFLCANLSQGKRHSQRRATSIVSFDYPIVHRTRLVAK
jgi:hypothetical protein